MNRVLDFLNLSGLEVEWYDEDALWNRDLKGFRVVQGVLHIGVLFVIIMLELRTGKTDMRNWILCTIATYMGIVLGQGLLRMNVYDRDTLKCLFVNTIQPFVVTYAYIYKEPVCPVRMVLIIPILYWTMMCLSGTVRLHGSRAEKNSNEWKIKVMWSEKVKMMLCIFQIIWYLGIPMIANL